MRKLIAVFLVVSLMASETLAQGGRVGGGGAELARAVAARVVEARASSSSPR